MKQLKYTEAETDQHFTDARLIFLEYQKYLGINLDFQDFQSELAELPGKYASPAGSIILVYDRDKCIGCVALRPYAEDICEMKRLFVKPDYRGKNIGRELCSRIIKKAIEIGYSRMRLDTLATMKSAITIYKQAGFLEIPPYYHNPLPNVVYFERNL
jgi:GNAT superfamily N-acetyltransferase